MQQLFGLLEVGGGRRIGPAQAGRVADSPAGQLQPQGTEIGAENFRGIEGAQAPLFVLAPEAQAVTGTQTAGPTGPLGGRGPGDPPGDQAVEAAVGIKEGAALPATIHHGVNAFNGAAGFGNGGGENYPAAAAGVRLHRCGLSAEAEIAVKGEDKQLITGICKMWRPVIVCEDRRGVAG